MTRNLKNSVMNHVCVTLMKWCVLCALIIILFESVGISYALPDIMVTTDKPIYKYGESLSFTITVSNVTGVVATFEIVDQQGHSSSPIKIDISKPMSSIKAPVPFYRTTFSPGTYFINVQYSGANATTNFQLKDTGIIAIPPQFKIVAGSWAEGQTSDIVFAEHVLELVRSGVIKIDNYQGQDIIFIPYWVKNDARWWSNGTITDNEFGQAIKYLLESNIMKISSVLPSDSIGSSSCNTCNYD